MVKDKIIEEETKISEEPVRPAAPVAAEEIKEEEEESQVEPEGHVYLEEAVEFAVESEAEESKTEVAEETKRESEIEEIEIIEKKIEPELEEFIELVESLMKEEVEEVKEIQEQGEISITDLSLNEHMRDYFKTEPFEKTTRWPFLIMLAALSFLLLLMPALYFFGVLDNWIGKKDKGKIETSVLMRMPVPVQVEIPKLSTPKKSPSTLSIPTKPRKQLVPEKPPVISIATAKPPKPSVPEKPSSISLDIVVYTAKKGDTLFKITTKHTGNGFNYLKVAKRNKMKNQDLIFPGQKIQIKR